MKSFRVQVVVWIASVVAVALIGLGTAISGLTLGRISAGIDAELIQRSRPFGGPGGPIGPPRSMQERSPFGNQMRPPPREGLGNEQAELIGDIRRPRVVRSALPVPPDVPQGQVSDVPFDKEAVQRALEGPPLFTEVVFRNERIRVYSRAFKVESDPTPVVVQTARELRDYNEVKRIQTDMLSVFLPLGLVAAVAVAWFLTGRVMRPIREMERAAQAIGSGNLSERLKVAGDDEFAQLGTQFNEMADNVQGSIQRLEQSLEQQRRFTADASHELRTPLTRMLLATSSAENVADDQLRAPLKTVDSAARDMSKLVQQLLELANLESGSAAKSLSRLDLRLVVSEAVLKTTGDPALFDVRLPETAVMVKGNSDLLERACLNVLENARRYSPPDKSVQVVLVQAGLQASLTIADEGPGISAEHIPHLTERFYRVDMARTREEGGSGLGLAIVDEIVQLHAGTLSFKSSPGQGLTVSIALPLL